MPSVDVINLKNAKVGTLELADAVFGATVNEALLYEAVRHYMAVKRRGTASTKTRHEVAGSGVRVLDVALEHRHLNPPLAAAADLDRGKLARSHECVGLRRGDVQHFSDI